MKSVTCLPLLAACNLTPTPWPDRSVAPLGEAPYGHPTDKVCNRRDDPRAFEVDGFLFCAEYAAKDKIVVDDPLFRRCDEIVEPLGPVFAVHDGRLARAYVLDEIRPREIVNDWWGDEPILVDF